jgi:hypothetical protein
VRRRGGRAGASDAPLDRSLLGIYRYFLIRGPIVYFAGFFAREVEQALSRITPAMTLGMAARGLDEMM